MIDTPTRKFSFLYVHQYWEVIAVEAKFGFLSQSSNITYAWRPAWDIRHGGIREEGSVRKNALRSFVQEKLTGRSAKIFRRFYIISDSCNYILRLERAVAMSTITQFGDTFLCIICTIK
jgi:hypothetical protein